MKKRLRQKKKSVSMDWKPERAVQAKVRDIKKNENDYPDRLKTYKGDLRKS